MGEATQTNNDKVVQKTETQNKVVEEPPIFCPVKLTEDTSTRQQNSTADIEQKLQEFLSVVNEESTQLSKFLADESKLVDEVCMALVTVIKRLGISFNIHPLDIPFRREVKKAVLNKDGKLVLTYDKDESHSAFLAEYPPEIIMAVLWVVIPELARAITTYRKKLSTRASFLEKVKKELRAVAKVIETEEAKTELRTEQNGWC